MKLKETKNLSRKVLDSIKIQPKTLLNTNTQIVLCKTVDFFYCFENYEQNNCVVFVLYMLTSCNLKRVKQQKKNQQLITNY